MIAIRGAVQADQNRADEILRKTRELLTEIQTRNGLEPDDVLSALFTMTPDLDADFPAHAARQMGWEAVAMLGAQETAVPGAPERMIRVLLHAGIDGPPQHVYLGGAAALRPDRAADGRDPLPVSRPSARGTGGSDPPGPTIIVGFGLIGGSLALELEATEFAPLYAIDQDPGAVERGRSSGLLEGVGNEGPEEILARARTVLLALPVDRIPAWIDRWGSAIADGAVVIDVGSTKADVVAAMERLPGGVEAIGSHPMSGSEQAGFGAARKGLFRGCPWAVVEAERTGDRARSRLNALIETARAVPIQVAAPQHDDEVARASHLPWLVATVLSRCGEARSGPPRFAGPGWHDTTRLSTTDPSMIRGILSTNWKQIREAGGRFEREWERLVGELDDAASAAGEDGGVRLQRLLGRLAER